MPVACHGGAIMTDGPELEAVGLPAMEGGAFGSAWVVTCINVVRTYNLP